MLRRELFGHFDVCVKMVVECEQGPDTMERRELDNHGRFLCKERTVSCPLLCGLKIKRKYHTSHILECKNTGQPAPSLAVERLFRMWEVTTGNMDNSTLSCCYRYAHF
ncbi:Hypp6800 [Branchiostoma lanceolatum]|uniref:Hypp6800 protein n=1 Tax=Branchiostoma lanceolatum TaxID=7740 RepID=A0A8J9YVI5_BRALA|nr:Hypp6800 [Branchiostoma lanceolatum]